MKLIRILCAAFLAVSFLSGFASAASTQFFSSIPDMPLQEGLTELTDQTLVFDKPEGRIIESVALIHGQAPAAVLRFYNEALPQLGWARIAENSFRRESEILKMSVEANEGKSFLRVNIAPSPGTSK